MTVRRLVCFLFVCLVAACASAPSRQTSTRKSALVVVLVVDQMRASYLDDYGSQFTAGLRRLIDEGAWFRRAAYPYLNTVTCPGHATIGTGAFPWRHGMVLNGWWDRQAGQSRLCTADASVKNLAYEGTVTGGDSAGSLLLPPLAQQLREGTGGQSVILSLKPRSAITLGGSNPSAVVWFDDRAGWTTSAAFGRPVEWLQAYFKDHPYTNDIGKPWQRLLPGGSYRGEDGGVGERAPSGWTTTFPHTLGQPAGQFRLQWQRSPFADDYLGRLGAHALEATNLGRGNGVDFLAVSFSSLDLVGHQFGPDSHEVQDVLFRLDRTIGTLLDGLDARMGGRNYVLALTADHGVAALPERTGGGRVASDDIVTTVNRALQPFFGPGKYVAHTAYTDIYLMPGVFDRLTASNAASAAVLEALRGVRGIERAFRADELTSAAARTSNDRAIRAAALSYYAGRSGDIIIVPRENWLLSSSNATTHGTLHSYDQRVPVIFFGAGVRAGVRDDAATPADVAPTLAALAGAPFKRTDGSALLRGESR